MRARPSVEANATGVRFDDAAMREALARKRDGGALSAEAWHALTRAYLGGVVDDAQMAAMLMACAIRGLSGAETAALTEAFVASGSRVPAIEGAVDKHSSGGVGDSLSLIAVPWVAACGVPVAKLSGRALGHTGGTLDKLEAVPGVSTQISLARFRAVVDDAGCAIAAQTAELVPADKRLYALRDRTATVAEPGLIAASIVSKKIAGGAPAIVYDIKTGAGAFMRETRAASGLARTIVEATRSFGRRAIALVTDMDEPLGRAIGSGIETIEARDFLSDTQRDARLFEAARTIADAMLRASGAPRFADARARSEALEGTLASGAAYERLERLLGALGARPGALAALTAYDKNYSVLAPRSGFVRRVEPVPIGSLARELTERFGPFAGIVVRVRAGRRVTAGDVLATVHGDEDAALRATEAFSIGDAAPDSRPFVWEEVGSES